MAISVTHPFVSGKADSGDATLVNASNWNAAHTITMATDRLLGRDTAAAGAVEEITVGGGIEFTGSTGIQTSAFTGDVTKTAGGTATTIANAAVTLAKMANLAQDTLIGRSTASTGVPETITCTAAARSILDDTTTAAIATTLGLGTASTPNFAGVTLTSTDAGAVEGPTFDLFRNSASPAASDYIGELKYTGKSSTGVTRSYASQYGVINSPTNAAEYGLHAFYAMNNGTGKLVLEVGATSGNGNYATLYNDDAGATAGPNLLLYRDSASPAAADVMGQLRFAGKDSGGNFIDYVRLTSSILDPTNGSEDGKLELVTVVAGAEVVALGLANGVVSGAPTGSYKGTGTFNAVTIYQNDVLVLTETGTQTATNKTFTADKQTVHTFAAASSFSVTASNGNIQRCPTNGNATITLPADVTGQMFSLDIEYGGTHTVTWATTGGDTIEWAGGVAPTATSVSGKVDRYLFLCTEANIWRGVDGGRNF